MKKAPAITIITSVMVVYSVVLAWVSMALGIDRSTVSDTYGYLQTLNWILFPLYWPILAWAIYVSWEYYMAAWRSLSEHNVLFQKERPIHDRAVIAPFLNELVIHRRCIIGVSLILGITLTSIDASCLWNEYGILTSKPLQSCTAKDFTIAFRWQYPVDGSNTDKILGRDKNLAFVVATYAMQGILIAFAWIILFQLLIHTIFFLRFEKLGYPKATQLSLKLNPRDPFLEYGLSEVNRAIHTSYMCIAFGMIIPVISAYSQQPNPDPLDRDVGQWLFIGLLPILIVPSIITWLDRVRRLKQVKSYIKAKNDFELFMMYSQQKHVPTIFGRIVYVVLIGYALILPEKAKDIANIIVAVFK